MFGLTLGLDEVEIGLDNAHTDQLEQIDASKNEKKKTRGLTLMHDVTRIKCTEENTIVEYNENGVPIGENGHKLQSFIGSCVHHHIPITHASLKVVSIELKEKVCNMVEDEILDKSPNDESPNDALSQALGTPEYGGREKVLEVVKEKKEIATSVPLISLTSKKKVVEEEEVIVTRPSISKNEVKASRPMTKEVEVTNEPSNLPIQLNYVLREDVIDFCNMQKVKTLSMVAYIMYLYSLIIDLKKVSKYVFIDPSLISAGHSTREIRARNLCSRLMTSKQDQLVVAPYNPGDHWSLVVINSYDDVVYHLDSLRTSFRDDIKYVTNMALMIFQSQKNLKTTKKTTFWKAVKCLLQVGNVECGYYVMRYMLEIVSKDTNIITDAIDTRNSYSQLKLDEIRVEWAKFLAWYI
ncbi:uncharacterized protein E6C27_scaffold548G00390 [Cucumis melo var. makuwa]|uniref:Ubiquitin-like protease family profile domain-containing protein n=1 Tax=Cucumis melo var. makuwa TaxID=1194695 RepID=A0A5A7VCM5_CUCMM|nr:uncharacterized protein E6C27_scaffold548G00390 [Cucumis melo var. makuwa]